MFKPGCDGVRWGVRAATVNLVEVLKGDGGLSYVDGFGGGLVVV